MLLFLFIFILNLPNYFLMSIHRFNADIRINENPFMEKTEDNWIGKFYPSHFFFLKKGIVWSVFFYAFLDSFFK